MLKLKLFIAHNYVVHFQEKQYKTYLETFSKGSMMLVMDCVEIYIFSRIQWNVKNALAFFFIYHIGTHMLLMESWIRLRMHIMVYPIGKKIGITSQTY